MHEHLVWKDKVPHGDYGADVSEATLNRFCNVAESAFESLYEDLKKETRGNTAVYGNETGWYVNGDRCWVLGVCRQGSGQSLLLTSQGRERLYYPC